MGGGGGDAADKHKQKQTSRISEVFGRQSFCLLVSMLFFEASLSVPTISQQNLQVVVENVKV